MADDGLNAIEKLKIKMMAKEKTTVNYTNNLPEEVKNSSANYANYKGHLQQVVEEMHTLMNGHPDCQPGPEFKKEVFAPPGASGTDQLLRGLILMKEHAWESTLIEREIEYCARAREVERQFQKEGFARIRNCRRFLSVEYPKFQLLEAEAIKLSNAVLIKGGERQQPLYQSKVAQMSEILSTRTEEQKVEHLNDLAMFMEAYADYHDRMAAEHERQINYSPAMYEQPPLKVKERKEQHQL